jgi:hypothetical protein
LLGQFGEREGHLQPREPEQSDQNNSQIYQIRKLIAGKTDSCSFAKQPLMYGTYAFEANLG